MTHPHYELIGKLLDARPDVRAALDAAGCDWVPTAADLDLMPTIGVGQADDSKVETADTRVWLSRASKEDGEPFDGCVTIEWFLAGRWENLVQYAGRPVDMDEAPRWNTQSSLVDGMLRGDIPAERL